MESPVHKQQGLRHNISTATTLMCESTNKIPPINHRQQPVGTEAWLTDPSSAQFLADARSELARNCQGQIHSLASNQGGTHMHTRWISRVGEIEDSSSD